MLRTSAKTNVFRDAVISTIGSGHLDEVLICSGFYQENFQGSHFQVSGEASFAKVCAASKIRLTTVGVHNNTWKSSYRDFRDNMKAAGVAINSYYKAGLKWHAKVYIGFRGGDPLVGIVGSSNLTRPAFSVTSPFNNECDVYLWDRKSKINDAALAAAEAASSQILIRAPYVPRLNGGRTVSQILSMVRDEVLSEDLKEL